MKLDSPLINLHSPLFDVSLNGNFFFVEVCLFFFVSFINQVDRYTVFIAESLMNGNCFGLISCERVMCSFNNGHCFFSNFVLNSYCQAINFSAVIN